MAFRSGRLTAGQSHSRAVASLESSILPMAQYSQSAIFLSAIDADLTAHGTAMARFYFLLAARRFTAYRQLAANHGRFLALRYHRRKDFCGGHSSSLTANTSSTC